MKPVKQTLSTNCFAGALASILEIDPCRIDAEVKELTKSGVHSKLTYPTAEMMPVEYLPWLELYELSLICVPAKSVEERWLNQFYIGVGVSPRDKSVMHAVVCLKGNVIWDPYLGVHSTPVEEILYCYFLTSLVPKVPSIPPEELPCLTGERKAGAQTKTPRNLTKEELSEVALDFGTCALTDSNVEKALEGPKATALRKAIREHKAKIA